LKNALLAAMAKPGVETAAQVSTGFADFVSYHIKIIAALI
jgi:hypothetical protein